MRSDCFWAILWRMYAASLENYILQIEADHQPKTDPIAAALEAVRGQLAQLQSQQENICEYLEKGVYTIDMFTKRNASLTKEIKQLQSAEADLLRQQGKEAGNSADHPHDPAHP